MQSPNLPWQSPQQITQLILKHWPDLLENFMSDPDSLDEDLGDLVYTCQRHNVTNAEELTEAVAKLQGQFSYLSQQEVSEVYNKCPLPMTLPEYQQTLRTLRPDVPEWTQEVLEDFEDLDSFIQFANPIPTN